MARVEASPHHSIVKNTTRCNERRERGAHVEMSFNLRLESGVTVPRDGNAISGNSRLRSDGVSPFTRVKKNKFRFYYICYYHFLADIRLQRAQFRNFESKYDGSYVVSRDLTVISFYFFLKEDSDTILNCTMCDYFRFTVVEFYETSSRRSYSRPISELS